MESFSQKYPQFMAMANAMMAGRDGRAGLQVTENGQIIGKYTFNLDGITITNVEIGNLDSGIHHPFIGTVKPYATIERNALEAMLNDEQSFIEEPFPTIIKYLPRITINFLP